MLKCNKATKCTPNGEINLKNYDSSHIKNITIAGHSGSGKTSLCEALLYKAGVTDRLGKTQDGNTVSDYTPIEVSKKCSIYTSLSFYERDGYKVNILDTPGLFDYAGGLVEGVFAADCVMIAVSAKSGIHVGTKKAYDAAVAHKTPHMFVVTKIDDENANFSNVLTSLKIEFGSNVCPLVVPIIKDSKIVSYYDLLEMKNYKYGPKGERIDAGEPDPTYRIDGLLEAMAEAVAETDEELMLKFLDGEKLTHDELVSGIHNGINSGMITPVTCVSSTNLEGVDLLIEHITKLFPSAHEMGGVKATDSSGKEGRIVCENDAPLSAFVFKTVADPFVGKMSFIKVISGKIESNKEVVNATTGGTEKVGKLLNLVGKKQFEVPSASAGDIVVATKMSVNTGDTVCDPARVVSFDRLVFPRPCYSVCVKAKSQGDESKISNAIQRLLEEDRTLSYSQDDTTFEQILSGLGEQHIESTLSKLKTGFGVDVITSTPKVSYKETIRKKVKVQGRHKKQSGGHGQYGDVWIEFEPCDSDELVFEENVFGGAVPRNFFPAVEKGLQDCMKKGVLAGFPVVGVKATLVDGSYHPVDSSEMSFKLAAAIAFKEGMKQAGPVLLEPIASLEVTVPDSNTGDMMGELNKRRGRVLGMNPAKKGLTTIVAEVPESEMHDFAMTVRQMTRGMGEFSMERLRYEQLPPMLAADVIAKFKVDDE